MCNLWNHRLGHPHSNRLFKILNSEILFDSLKFNKNDVDDSFHAFSLSKSKVSPFHLGTSKCTSMFELMHTDVWGPAPILSKFGTRFCYFFIDDLTRFTWIYFMHAKSKAFTIFKQFFAMVDNQFQKSIKTLQSNS